MTFQAGVQGLFGCELRKGNDGRLASMGFDMGSPRAMATFTACVFRFLCATRDALEMGVLIKHGPDVWMACFADRAADIIVLRLLLGVDRHSRKSYERKQAHNGALPRAAKIRAAHRSAEMDALVACFRCIK